VRTGASEYTPPQGDNFDFVIETLDGVLVGGVDSHECNPRNGTFMFGIAIFPQQRGKGYASEAIRLMLHYYFSEKRYQKCHSVVFSFNSASIRLHERLGFTLEARLRRMIYSGGEYHDELHYGLTKEEFERLNALQ
jgi:RimJ/RimL family protein N-acetyltransferase